MEEKRDEREERKEETRDGGRRGRTGEQRVNLRNHSVVLPLQWVGVAFYLMKSLLLFYCSPWKTGETQKLS